MIGRSHLIMGLAAGVIVDSFLHISGPAITSGDSVSVEGLAMKGVYYFAVGFGALLPDVDNARSTLGQKFGNISKFIHKTVGHRTLFHSLLGLALGSLLALGLGQLVDLLLTSNGLTPPEAAITTWQVFFYGTLMGCIIHILCDSLTIAGVPLLWPMKGRFGIPPVRDWRFESGSWIENVVVVLFVVLVIAGIWFRFFII